MTNNKIFGSVGEIVEATVKSVGSKYITTISGNWNTERKFEIDNEFREYYTIGSSDYQLFLSKEQIEEDNEAILLEDHLRNIFKQYGKINLSLDQLRRIKVIVDECE